MKFVGSWNQKKGYKIYGLFEICVIPTVDMNDMPPTQTIKTTPSLIMYIVVEMMAKLYCGSCTYIYVYLIYRTHKSLVSAEYYDS